LVSDAGLGSSPDAQCIAENACVEVKCPSPAQHLEYLIGTEVPLQYRPQVHGQMVVGEYDRAYFVSYHPGLPVLIKRVERDDYTEKVGAAASRFLDNLERLGEQIGAPPAAPSIDLGDCPDWVLDLVELRGFDE